MAKVKHSLDLMIEQWYHSILMAMLIIIAVVWVDLLKEQNTFKIFDLLTWFNNWQREVGPLMESTLKPKMSKMRPFHPSLQG